mgnify:CR=1 FL=1
MSLSMSRLSLAFLLGLVATVAACGRGGSPDAGRSAPAQRPSILLVTLDTTRADAIGPEAKGVETPAFNALATRGRRFRQAYAPAPETLPSHASMFTGLYPAGHGVHENARTVPARHPHAAEQLQRGGYRTAAFVSAFVLARRFGLARGFETYDDELAGAVERSARDTTERALAYLEAVGRDRPLLLWVHYFDPHAPYAPPEPFRTRYATQPYLGEVAAMDEQLGRLVAAFERRAPGPVAIVVASDHGEGLGDHGELQHGHLLYQPTMHVPLVVVGPGIEPGVSDAPVSLRRIHHTLVDWAGLDPSGEATRHSLRAGAPEVVLGEAMKPFLSYGWQPQIMAVEGTKKAIYAGRYEVYDVAADPGERRNLEPVSGVPASLRRATDGYPVPTPGATPAADTLTDEARRQLASLGYVSATAQPVVRRDAPRPVDMVKLFEVIDRASTLFVQQRYAEVIPLLERILRDDPFNLDATLRLATAQSMLGRDAQAVASFRKAAELAPQSQDVRLYFALHQERGRDWAQAVPTLERIVADTPERLPAVEALARVRERQGRPAEAVALWQQVHTLREPTPADLVKLGTLAMEVGDTAVALSAFERAREQQGAAFRHDLELGVLYVATRQLEQARAALDRVPAGHPGYPMALFKRAQVSVLLKEPDAPARIARARQQADATTRGLIATERLFR